MNFIKPVYAVTEFGLETEKAGNLCAGEGLGPFAKFLCTFNRPASDQTLEQQATENIGNANQAVRAFAVLFSNIIGVFVVVAGLLFLFQFMLGGFKWLTAGGDKAKLESAQQSLLHAVIGLVIVLAAYAIVVLVGSILGIDILLNNPEQFVDQLNPALTPVE